MSSEVARFREQQALEESASQQALNGLAHVGSHEWITARTEACSRQVLDLLASGDTEGAAALVLNDTFWEIKG